MFPLLLGTQQIWDIKEGENADNLGPMAWLFLQENVQVQYLQKIALRAENKRVQCLVTSSTRIIFCIAIFCCH